MKGLKKYIEKNGDNQKWVSITKIIVPSQYDKDQLLRAFEYIHDSRTLDSDYLAVNYIMHLYEHPEKIIIGG
jgi:hypothetical protein